MLDTLTMKAVGSTAALLIILLSLRHVQYQEAAATNSSGRSTIGLNELRSAAVPGSAVGLDGTVKLVDGRTGQFGYREWVGLSAEPGGHVFRDFDGDGAGDAAAVLVAETGGSGRFYYLAVFRNNYGRPKFQDAALLGDHINVKNVAVYQVDSDSGLVFAVDVITSGRGEDTCCATTLARQLYGFRGGVFVSL